MAKQFANLKRIDNNEPITCEKHYEFLYYLHRALLLALREQGLLNAMQYHHAEEKLNQQRRNRARNLMEKGECL